MGSVRTGMGGIADENGATLNPRLQWVQVPHLPDGHIFAEPIRICICQLEGMKASGKSIRKKVLPHWRKVVVRLDQRLHAALAGPLVVYALV
jgi:hypothetical protein